MGKHDVEARYSITDDQRRRIEQATYRSLLAFYMAAMAAELRQRGARHGHVIVTDTAVLLTLKRMARRRAELIQQGINTRIAARLDGAPENLSDSELEQHLQPTLDGIREYNATVLAVWMERWATQRAQCDLFARNGIDAVWRWVTESGACPACLEIESDGPYSTQDASAIDTPAHPNCRCEWVCDVSNLSPDDFAWFGQEQEAA